MKNYFQNRSNSSTAFFFCLFMLILFWSCQKEEIAKEVKQLDAKATKAKVAAFFPTFHQNFNHDTSIWADQDVEGILGWCGSIELRDKGSSDITPSAGRGYAVVMQGPCNEFWSEDPAAPANFSEGAPATQDPDLWSVTWPESGFVQELDIYLDPGMFSTGHAFTYASSIKTREGIAFHYFPVTVMNSGEFLKIDDFTIEETSWYTFRFLFGTDLQNKKEVVDVDFELLKNGQPIYRTSIDQTMAQLPTSSLAPEDFGSGYVWFAAIAEGVALPIDEYFLRPGK